MSLMWWLIVPLLLLGDDWKAAQASDRHPLHLLHPVSMDLGLEKSLTDKSTRLPLYASFNVHV